MAYAASTNTDAAARGGRPSRHVPAVRNPSASSDNESSHGSASKLPPATSHGYAKWDFSWTVEAQEALDKLKAMLAHAPILTPPRGDEPLYLYVATTTQVVSAVIVVERT
jgi:hypothetical protein